jgi:thiamine-monophosphate kinase
MVEFSSFPTMNSFLPRPETVHIMTENDFLRQLKARYPATSFVTVGIGDDGAVLSPQEKSQVVVTDLLLDGVHFDLRQTPPRLAGRKAMAVNLSDLAAMGCHPTAAFVSIAVPRQLPVGMTSTGFLSQLYEGFEELTSEFNFVVAGGDTNSWNGPFAVNVCLTGIPFDVNGRCFLRSTAKPGDILLVSGPLGGSLASGRHLSFQPRLKLASWLSFRDGIHAAMDISDGLSTDLLRMMEASQTSAILEGSLVPIHQDVPPSWPLEKRLAAALSDGEDFELLLSVAAPLADQLISDAAAAGFDLFRIGRVASAGESRLVTLDGNKIALQSTGWQHSM